MDQRLAPGPRPLQASAGQSSFLPAGSSGHGPRNGRLEQGTSTAGAYAKNDLPSVTLPKGGGAISGIGEKFTTNPVTGTGSMSVPIATSPSRSDFGPQLSLNYDSGAGNGPFGFGWTLSIPAITRKTDKGIPRYADSEESDVFVLSGNEDLVPVLNSDGTRHTDTAIAPEWTIQRYRPRIEGLFARIERWVEHGSGQTHWRTISRDNVTTLYGLTPESTVADGDRVFRWLICESYDDKGNVIVYDYVAEDDTNVIITKLSEQRRFRGSNRYLKRIRYGNRVSRLVQPDLRAPDWMFEVVFDYGEGHHQAVPLDPSLPADAQLPRVQATADAPHGWAARPDPFSTYRAGFELRTHRRCHRVLMFHHFPELGPDPCLVRSTQFDYADLDLTIADVGSREADRGDLVNEELAHPGSTRFASFIHSITQTGYVRDHDTAPALRNGSTFVTYITRSLPSLELRYSKAILSEEIHELDAADLQNLPAGLDSRTYQWVDLDGEGVSGILTDQAGIWYYKQNLGDGHFGPLQRVTSQPTAINLAAGQGQLLDLAGDGRLDATVLASPVAGFYRRIGDENWEPFRTFAQLPAIAWDDPNLRFIDLDGDGHADVLITQDDTLTWYPSLAEQGFGSARRVLQPVEESNGPRLMFADGEMAVYLADMSGDGLIDLVRIRNGQVCYWPNQGYGRFGAQVVLDNSPWFDYPDQFDQRRIRLADIDGSGTTDLIYLGTSDICLYFNQSGNRLTAPRRLRGFPASVQHTSVQVADLFGNGTACLVWSSPLPTDIGRPMWYIDLLGGIKPHLLTMSANNLGAENHVRYAPSTRFYLDDKAAGRPWITRIPFPVHVVDRVETLDRVSRNRFVTRYAYHHGYFDGIEREFRGFCMVEQWDTEELDSLNSPGERIRATNVDEASNVAPVLTRTWFHNGALMDRSHISDYFAGTAGARGTGDYYREPGLTDSQARDLLLNDTILPGGLTIDEEREACRALKGAMLRQEIYALDATPRAEHPYSVIEQNFTIAVLQHQYTNRHAVVFAHPRESLSYHYERNPEDPRIAHTLTLRVDAYGNVLESAAIGYGRRRADPDLSVADQTVQARTLVTCAINGFTNPIDTADAHRAPAACETRTYELVGLTSPGQRFTFDEVRAGVAVANRAENEGVPGSGSVQKRLIAHLRTLYRSDDLTRILTLGELEPLALPFQAYQLALSPSLVTTVYGDRVRDAMLESEARYVHPGGDPGWWIPSGHMFYSPNSADTPEQELAAARQGFFLPRRYRDPFYTETVSGDSFVTYDIHNLLPLETRDALNNLVTAGQRAIEPNQPLAANGLDYRVLRPALVMDPNRNCTALAFDALGMVVANAIMGKPEEIPAPGDHLTSTFTTDLTQAQIAAFLAAPSGPLGQQLLENATSRIVYDLDSYRRTSDTRPQPATAVTLARENHVAAYQSPSWWQRIQVTLSYSDGFGREIQRKVQAEPGPVPKRGSDGAIVVDDDGQPRLSDTATTRWVGSGWTIFNNKGKPVRQYEPFFSDTHNFEFDIRIGVSAILFYDPLDRVVLTLHPNHTWEKVVFGPWRHAAWDANDTSLVADPASDPDIGRWITKLPDRIYLPTWHALRTDAAHAARAARLWPDVRTRAAEQRAATLTAVHAETPTVTHTDSLGRPVLIVAHNRYRYSNTPIGAAPVNDYHQTRVVLDVEGNQRELIDALNRLVMRYEYDLLGTKIYQGSMEAGERWTLNDVAGKPVYAWDSRDHIFRTTYDALRRPMESFLRVDDSAEIIIGRTEYGESRQNPEIDNVRGRATQIFDQAGVVISDQYDFKGNLLRHRRQLSPVYDATLDWAGNVPLEPEEYTIRTRYDALNRVVQQVAFYGGEARGRVNVVQHRYNDANLVDQIDSWISIGAEPDGLLDASTATLHAITKIDYDAKGMRTQITYGNATVSVYRYDPLTLRLASLVTRRDPSAFAADSQPSPAPGWPGSCLQNLTYTYDPAGNVTTVRDDAQQTIFFRNTRVEPSNNYAYDATYQLIEATGREHLGQVGGVPVPHSHDDAPRVGLLHPGDGNAMGRYLERYVYDAVGNMLSTRHLGSDPAHAGWTRSYTYAERSQLEPTKVSNRLTMTALGQANEVYSTGDGYDAHGNMLFLPQLGTAGAASNLKWDHRNQLRDADLGAIGFLHCSYDDTGQRVRKILRKANGVIEQRAYFGDFELFLRENSGSDRLERETLHITDGAKRIVIIETRTVDTAGGDQAPPQVFRYQLCNHVGSPVLELDSRAEMLSYEEYSPFGSSVYQAITPRTMPAKRFRYINKERDEETGLNYHGARYYVPWLGRWSSADPNWGQDPPNLYLYAGNRPTSLVDPGGAEPEDPDEGTVGRPGFAESLIPIWGSGREAVYNFQKGNWGWGIAYTALAVSDVFLVKSLATAAGKAVIKGGATLLARQAAKEAARLAAKEAAEQAAKLAAKEAAEQAAKEAAEQAAKEAAEQAAKEAAEQAAKKAAEQAAKDAAKKAAERAASDVADRTAGEVAGHTGAGAGQGGSKLLHAGKAGSVVANKLLKHEIQFAKEIVAHRGGKLIGMARRSAPGIDALLEGAPISLKETKGGLLSVLRHASAAEAQAKAAGYAGVELFIKAENVELAKLLDFASKGGLKGGLSKIPTQGIISAINVLTKNGWVRFIP